jgi:hypothetical protein
MMKRIGAVTLGLAMATMATAGISYRASACDAAQGPDSIDPATFRLVGAAGEDALLSWSDYRFDIDYSSLSAGLEGVEHSGIGSSDDTDTP